MTGDENKTRIKYFILCIIDRSHKNYDKISYETRIFINSLLTKYQFTIGGDLDDYESWYTWKGSIPIAFVDSEKESYIVIKHYKVRIIIEIIQEYESKDLITLFKMARKGREIINKNELIENILKIQIQGHINRIYSYPFIQILRKYTSKDFNKFGDESITSFSYEVHDAKRENIFSIFLWKPKITLIRVTRPSIITTEMSNFMQSEIINAIYDTCLISLREKRLPEPTDEIFRDMRDHIGQVLFIHEETVASAELNRSVNTLSIIAIIGALAGIFALITVTFTPLPRFGSLNPKSLLGHVLLLASIIILIMVITKYKK